VLDYPLFTLFCALCRRQYWLRNKPLGFALVRLLQFLKARL